MDEILVHLTILAEYARVRFLPGAKIFVCSLVELHALAPGLDLGPKVQVPQKMENACQAWQWTPGFGKSDLHATSVH